MNPAQLKKFYSSLIRSGDLCFDVGANAGNQTRAFLELGAHVVAIEPQVDLCAQISSAMYSEVAARRLRVLPLALGAARGKAWMFPASDPTKSMTTLSEDFMEVSKRNGDQLWSAEPSQTTLETLDHLIEMFGTPDYIKIDVEGYDAEVLRGLSQPVPLISFEYNTQPGLLEVALRCVDRVADLGDYVFNYVPEGESSLHSPTWINAGDMHGTLLLATSPYCFGDIFARLRKGRHKDCPICATATDKHLAGSPYFMCSGCGLWFQSPLPPKTYHGPEEPGVEKIDPAEMQANRSLADWLFSFVLHSVAGRKVLDVGSKIPMLAKALRDLGCDAIGLDPMPAADRLGVPMKAADFETIDDAGILYGVDGLFDLITIVHVFEHFYQPEETLRKLRRLLSPTGRLYIRMPDNQVRGWERDISPHHFAIHGFYHSLSSIAELVARTNTFAIEWTCELQPGQRDLVLRPL